MEMSYEFCTLCPRNCGVNRNFTGGFCGETASLTAARAALHFWEEPPVSGTQGSGAVFFRGCNLKCVYCQNYSLSRNEGGMEISAERLLSVFLELEKAGAHNINLVTPTHFYPHILASLRLARGAGLKIPVVCNTSGYEKKETIASLKGSIDIYLTDFKYIRAETAKNYSAAPDYFEFAASALDEMVSQCPAPVIEDGIMKKGVIVRHLLLPGHLIEAKMIVKYLYERYGNSVYLSLMNQYTPLRSFPRFPNLERTVTQREYSSLVAYAARLGVTRCFVQEGGAAKDSFIPLFDNTGI